MSDLNDVQAVVFLLYKYLSFCVYQWLKSSIEGDSINSILVLCVGGHCVEAMQWFWYENVRH